MTDKTETENEVELDKKVFEYEVTFVAMLPMQQTGVYSHESDDPEVALADFEADMNAQNGIEQMTIVEFRPVEAGDAALNRSVN